MNDNNTFKLGFAIRAKHGIIYKYLKDNNLTLKFLANRIDVPYQWLMDIINLRRVPKIESDNVLKLLGFFSCDFEEMFPSQKLRAFGGECAVFQDIPKDKLVNWSHEEFNKLPAPEIANVSNQGLDQDLDVALSSLSHREEAILRLRFGMQGDPKTLQEIANQFDLSRARINQIENKALRKLRHPSRSNLIKKYLT